MDGRSPPRRVRAAAPPLEAEELLPPMTTTRPLRVVVAVWPERAVIRVGPAETVAGAGSKISVEARVCVAPSDPTAVPPMIRTRPSGSTAAAWLVRAVASVALGAKEFEL